MGSLFHYHELSDNYKVILPSLYISIPEVNSASGGVIFWNITSPFQASCISLVDVSTLENLGRGVQREGYAWQRAFGVTGYVVL